MDHLLKGMRFTILFFLFSYCLQAQENLNDVFTLKPSLGLNGCQIHGDNYSGFNKFGLFTGIAVNARLKEKLSLELGFYFSQKGSRHNPNPEKGDYDYLRINLNYIDIPLSLRYMVNSNYFITLGPSIAYLVSYSENYNYTDITSTSNFNRIEAGINIGLGRKIMNKFFVELRSSNSFLPIRDYGISSNVIYPNPVATYFNNGLYNNILTLFVTYKLDPKKKREN